MFADSLFQKEEQVSLDSIEGLCVETSNIQEKYTNLSKNVDIITLLCENFKEVYDFFATIVSILHKNSINVCLHYTPSRNMFEEGDKLECEFEYSYETGKIYWVLKTPHNSVIITSDNYKTPKTYEMLCDEIKTTTTYSDYIYFLNCWNKKVKQNILKLLYEHILEQKRQYSTDIENLENLKNHFQED